MKKPLMTRALSNFRHLVAIKLVIYTILLISVMLTLTQTLITFKDWSSYKDYIKRKLEKIYDADVYIGGKIEASLFMPKLIIHNVYIQRAGESASNLSNIGKIEITPSLLSLLTFSLQPKSITLIHAGSNRKTLYDLLSAKMHHNKVDFSIQDTPLCLEESCIYVKEISLKRNRLSGSIKIGENNYTFSGRIDITKKNVDISITSNVINLLFKGNKKQNILDGNLTLTINNLTSDPIKSANPSIRSNFIANEKITISSYINISENEFIMTDLKIDSPNIQGTGVIQKQNNHTNVMIKFKKFFLPAGLNIDIKGLLEYFKRSIPKNLSMNCNLSVEDVNNSYAIVKLADGEAIIDTYFKQGTNNLFHLSGKISSDELLSEFNGDLRVDGEDLESCIKYFFPTIELKDNQNDHFRFNARLHLGPRILSISDIGFFHDKGSVDGSIRLSYTKKRNIIDGVIGMHNFNADKYNFSSLFPMKWLKSFKYNANIKTNISNFTFHNTKIANLDFLLNVEKRKLEVNEITMYGEYFNTSGNIKISVDKQYPNPLVDINLIGEDLDCSAIKLPNFIEEVNDSKNAVRWSIQKLDFLKNLEKFDANIYVNTKKLKFAQSTLRDLYLDLSIRSGTVIINRVSSMLEGGKVFFNGYLKPDGIDTNFLILDLAIEKISRVIGIHNVTGNVNLTGNLSAHGNSFYDWANNISGEVQLDAQEIKFSSLDLNSLITSFIDNTKKSEMLIFFNSNMHKGSTIFKDIVSKIKISNGICIVENFQFKIDQAAGAMAAHLFLPDFTLRSMFKLYFIPPNSKRTEIMTIHLDGPIWHPVLSLD